MPYNLASVRLLSPARDLVTTSRNRHRGDSACDLVGTELRLERAGYLTSNDHQHQVSDEPVPVRLRVCLTLVRFLYLTGGALTSVI
jgi:hypothetical protein